MINTHRGLGTHLVMIAASKNQRQKGNNRTPLNCADPFSSAAHLTEAFIKRATMDKMMLFTARLIGACCNVSGLLVLDKQLKCNTQYQHIFIKFPC